MPYQREEEGRGPDITVGNITPQVLGLRDQSVKKRGGQKRGDGNLSGLEVLHQDRGAGAAVRLDVNKRCLGSLLAGVVIDHYERFPVGGERDVASPRLAVDQGYGGELFNMSGTEPDRFNMELFFKGPVLLPSQNSSVGDGGSDAFRLFQKILKRPAAGQGIRVGVVVRQDQEGRFSPADI